MPTPYTAGGMPSRSGRRDAGLATMARINRWMAAGAAVLAGGTSLIAWHGFRAHTAGLARAAARRAAPSHRHGDDGGSPPEGPAAPRSAPAAAPTPAPAAPAVSGGS